MAQQHSELYVAAMRAVATRDLAAMRELLPAIQQLRSAASDQSINDASTGAVPRAPPATAPLNRSEVASGHGLPPLLQMLADEPHAANAQMAGMLLGAGEAADGQPLHAAIMTGQPELVRILLDHGANPNQRAESAGDRLTPLHAAAVGALQYHHEAAAAAAEICGMLLAHGADAMAGAGVAGITPLQLAAMYGQLEVVNALLAHGPAARMLEAADSNGLSALHHALSGETSEAFDQPTPVQRAAVVQALLQAGAPVHAATHDMDMTALHLACASGFPECVPLLLAAGADPLRAAAKGILPVHTVGISASGDAWRALGPLVTAGGTAMLSTSCGFGLPLEAAVMYGRVGAARELLRLGAPVNQLSSACRGTALICAYGRGPATRIRDIVEWMDAQQAGRKVETFAPEDEVLPFVELLLAHGADPNLRVKVRGLPAEAPKYVTPLMQAVFAGHARVVAALLAAGADPTRSIMAGILLLHEAVAQGHLAVVQALLPSLKLADINDASSHQGGSPLHIACHNLNLECVRLLLAAGADPWVTCQGRTPSDLLTAQARGALPPADKRRSELIVNALRRAKERLQQQRGGARAAAGAAVPPGPAVPPPATQVSAAALASATTAAAVKACCYCGVLEGASSVQAGAQGMGIGGGSSSPAGAGAATAVSSPQAPPVKLKRCAACAMPMYCSEACQRAHWRAGHREECAANVAREASMAERFTGLLQQQQRQQQQAPGRKA